MRESHLYAFVLFRQDITAMECEHNRNSGAVTEQEQTGQSIMYVYDIVFAAAEHCMDGGDRTHVRHTAFRCIDDVDVDLDVVGGAGYRIKLFLDEDTISRMFRRRVHICDNQQPHVRVCIFPVENKRENPAYIAINDMRTATPLQL